MKQYHKVYDIYIRSLLGVFDIVLEKFENKQFFLEIMKTFFTFGYIFRLKLVI